MSDKEQSQTGAGTEGAAAPAASNKPSMTDAEMDRVTQTTADILKKQKKRKVRLYLPPEERAKLEAAEKGGRNVNWPSEFVQVNGYGYQIQRGKDVEVPESVAEILEQSGMI